jgi:hypothetical protein
MGGRTLPGPKPARKRPWRGPHGLGWKGEERFSVAHWHVAGLTGCVPPPQPATALSRFYVLASDPAFYFSRVCSWTGLLDFVEKELENSKYLLRPTFRDIVNYIKHCFYT